ncbi:ABC transporter ATP-binding protein [Lactobacillus iners]|uniref:ABC transporter ATP-binding protein n=1 Tax=Lactobacillus iners TaxID=147802 RepID=UPI00254D1F96|nr:ABC transporter ATP-binding protein [Lactobacillus iners]
MIRLIKWSPTFILGLLLSAIGSLVGIMIPLEMRKFIDSGKLGLRLDFSLLAVIVFLLVSQAIFQIVSEILVYVNGENRIAELRFNINNHILRLPIEFFINENGTEIAGHLINDTSTVKDFITIECISFFSGIVTIVGSIFAIFALDWKLSIVLLVILPIMVVMVVPLGNIGGKYAQIIQNITNELLSIASENYKNIKSIKVNVAEKPVSTLFKNKVYSLYCKSIKSDIIQAIVSPLGLIFLFASIGIIFSYGGYRVSEGSLSIGTLISFLVYIFQLLNPIGQFSDFFTEYKKAQGSMSKLNSIAKIPIEYNTNKVNNFDIGDIRLRNVSFSYGKNPVLTNINMNIEQFKKIAIVGPSGSGKSTLINLIVRLYNPISGCIEINNCDISRFDLYKWRSLFSIVNQERDIISGTIRDNLSFGIARKLSDEELIKALEQADLKSYILSLPDKLDTFIGEEGIKLSGGQKQRLQIARIYLKNTPYIVLDEATSNLDPDAEEVVMRAVDRIKGKKTILIIAHRLSTIRDADVIFFLENHKITGCGSHKYLLNNHESYKRFVYEQMI